MTLMIGASARSRVVYARFRAEALIMDAPSVDSARLGITANVVEAGLMASEMHEAAPPEVLEAVLSGLSLQRVGHPKEIAAAIAFPLASPAASYVTGAVLDAHGGYNA